MYHSIMYMMKVYEFGLVLFVGLWRNGGERMWPCGLQRGDASNGTITGRCREGSFIAAGMFTEVWTMGVQPALSSGAPPPPITLRGVAVEHDPNILRRRGLRRSLLQAQARREAANTLERLLIDLEAPDRGIRQLPGAEEARHAAFAAAVAREDPPLFFRAGLGTRLQAAEVAVRELVEQMGEISGGKGKKGAAPAPPPEAVAKALEEHQGSLESLERLVAVVRVPSSTCLAHHGAGLDAGEACTGSGACPRRRHRRRFGGPDGGPAGDSGSSHSPGRGHCAQRTRRTAGRAGGGRCGRCGRGRRAAGGD